MPTPDPTRAGRCPARQRSAPLAQPRAGAALAACVMLAAAVSGCRDECCLTDGRAIPLASGPTGELTVNVATDAGPQAGLLDPGSPLTFWHRPGRAQVTHRDLSLVGPAPPGQTPPLRASFPDIQVVEGPLGPLGDASGAPPAAILGADLLGRYAVEIGFTTRELTLWRRQSAADGFLAAAGYAILHLPRRGGGRLGLRAPSDWLGRQPEVEVPPARLIMRACAAPGVFRRADPLPERCCSVDLRRLATGTDVTLLLSTGVGPVVLGRAAWERVRARLPEVAPMVTRPLAVAFAPAPVEAEWTSIPRLALVDREADLVNDPGPCAELGRARRIEQIAVQQSQNSERARCVLPCDREPRGVLAENSAAYLEIEGRIEVAVIDDVTPFLQGVRAEVRPQGPEVDGLIGAAALAPARLEIDYFSADPRAIFSCEAGVMPTSFGAPPPAGGADAGGDAPADAPDAAPVDAGPAAPARKQTPPAALGCRAVGRCPRLPDATQQHLCFGLPPHGLPKMCDNDPRSCED